ncbi:MAG: hypothetical protein FJ279_32530 [Planctomycetes bacterium]|nr:hypothetical protein [Planctomycetota bacterium]MBM4079445.1 hypothetical protein [Planctomycetota bacterium]
MHKIDLYEYQAVTSSGEKTSGRLEAADLDDAIAKVRAQGLFPTSIRNVSRTFPPTDPALKSVQLWLLQASGDGASEVAFDLRSPEGVAVQYCIAGQWYPMVGFSEATADEVRRALRDLSGLPDLGQATVSAERVVNITSADFHKS